MEVGERTVVALSRALWAAADGMAKETAWRQSGM